MATAASVTAASGVLAKISSWLKPVKNIFSKVRGNAAVNKLTRKVSKGKDVSNKLQQRAAQYQQQQAYQANSQYIPETNASILPASFVRQQIPTNMARTPTTLNTKKGISKGAKVGIEIGVAAIIGTGAYFLFRDKDEKSPAQPKQKKKKQSLGAIELS